MKKITMVLALVFIAFAGAGILSACNHVCSYGEWQTVKAATCTEKGTMQRVCIDGSCGKKEVRDIETDPDNHKIEEIKGEDATCTTDGKSAHKHCLDCGKYFDMDGAEITQEQTVVSAKHTLTDISAKAATCTEDGNVEYKYCSVCKKNFDGQGNELSDNDVTIPARHNYTEIPGAAATDHVDGVAAHSHCSVCKKNFGSDGKEIADVAISAAHTSVYDKENLYCSVCDKYVITDAARLSAFRDYVNGGNDYSGKTVELEADIDLENEEWIPVNSFKGTFDGRNHVIKNLKITGGNSVGLFGNLWQCAATLRNFTIDGASIQGGENVGAVLGLTASAQINNVRVRNAEITSNHYAGGLVGYGYCIIDGCTAENVTVTCVPDLQTGGNYDNGDKVGGIVGYLCAGTVQGCSAENVALKGYRDIGGIVGALVASDGVETFAKSNASSKISITVDQVTNGYGGKDMNVGGIVGRRIDQTNNPAVVEDNRESEISYGFIVNNASAQKALDCAKSNSEIKLVAGEYDKLYIRQGKSVSVSTNDGSYPKYKREFKNISVIGEDGAVVNGVEFISGHIYSSDNSVTDPVTGKKQNYYSNLECADIAFRGIKFTEYMEFNGWESTLFSVDGLDITECEFDMTGSAKASFGGTVAAVHIGSSDGERNLKNFKFESCAFTNAFQGIYVVNVENMTVSDCRFETIKHNAIAMQSSANGSMCGNIVVENNTFTNGSDRVIRFNNIGETAVISVTDNVITDYSDADGEILKSGVMSVGAALKFENNIYGGVTLGAQNIQGAGTAVVLKNA